MKINKGISVLLASMLIGGMLVGCSNNSNSDTTKVLTKTVKDVTKDDTEVETTKDKEEEKTPSQDNNKSTQKDTNQKEIKSTKEATQKKSNENTTKEDKKEEPKQKGYYTTCSNGHKVWTVNGDYDCQQCYDDYMNQEDDETNDTEKKDIYWCSECQCFSTYKHNHPVEMPEDAEESIQEDDTYQEEYYEGKEEI